MRKRLNIKKTKDNLAVEMWGEIIEQTVYFSGLIYYKCKYYEGYIVDDKDFDIDNELRKKISPVTILEIYRYRNEQFIVERTDRHEKIPKILSSKFLNKRYEQRINVYTFTDKYMNILKYYHRNVLEYIYNNTLDEKSNKYKSLHGYINSEIREYIRDFALNSPEFVKKQDRKKAKKHLEQILEKRLKLISEKNEKARQEKLELVKDNIMQRIEIL